MSFSFFKVLYRNLAKYRASSFIQIAGLAIGMASVVLISLWIRYELDFEQFHTKKDLLYRVLTNAGEEGRILTGNTTPAPLAETVKKEFPEVHRTCRTSWVTNHLLQVDDSRITAAGIYTEPDFLRMFSFPLIQGDAATALRDVNAIVLTQDFAQELFGKQNPIGRMIRLDNQENAIVTGILKNIPSNTSFHFKYLLHFDKFLNRQQWLRDNWATQAVETYVELLPGASCAQLQHKLQDVPARHGEKGYQLLLHPLTKWYLYGRFEDGKIAGGRIEAVRLFGTIAVLVLLIACINFTNLSTARSEKRAKEVGVRKVLGVRQRELIVQFLSESILLAFLAGLVALLIVYCSLPAFHALLNTDFKPDFTDLRFWSVFLAFILFTGAGAGIYPAFYLATFNPVSVLKGISHKSQTLFSFHKGLVIVQFTIGITLMISSIVIQKQITYAQQRDRGYDKEKLIYIQFFGDLKKNYPLLKHELLSTGIASAVTQTSSPITESWDVSSRLKWPGKNPDDVVNFHLLCADGSLVNTFGFQVLAGREIDPVKFPTDSSACLLNEAAVKAMGLKNPIGQFIQSENLNWKVAGVVHDFIIGSPYSATEPLVVLGPKGWFHVVHIRLGKDRTTSENLKLTEAIVQKYNPSYPFEYHFVDEAYATKFNDEEKVAKLVGLFTALTIFVACLGLFGLAAYATERRRKEIGIRKVLGASTMHLAALLSIEFLKLVFIANLIASLAGWYLMQQWLQGFAYRIDLSGWVFAAAGVAALVITLVTVSGKAIKAARANPVQNLRTE